MTNMNKGKLLSDWYTPNMSYELFL